MTRPASQIERHNPPGPPGAGHDRRRLVVGLLLSLQVAALTCAVPVFATAGPRATEGVAVATARAIDGACAPEPSWITSAVLRPGGRDPLSTCFQAGSDQAEALLRVVNRGQGAELVAVSGPDGALSDYSFSDTLDARLASSLEGRGSDGRSRHLVAIGPDQRATLMIGRPPPQPAPEELLLSPARGAPAALAGLAWRLLAAARRRGAAAAGVQGCVAATLRGAASSSAASPRALALLRRCALRAAARVPAADRVVGGLVASVLSPRAFSAALALAHREAAAPEVLEIAGSPLTPTNPAIHLTLPALGSVPDGAQTVAHLSASGGTAPYRFYIWQERGAPAIPFWVRLDPDGTLTIEPPDGASAQVRLTVYAVDATGASSQDLP